MNRAPNRGGSGAGAGGKPPQCQRCLKFGKWTYECCTDASARVYVSRPSRTQQLKNPKVRQKFADFTGDEPPDPKAEYEARKAAVLGKYKGKGKKRGRRDSSSSSSSSSSSDSDLRFRLRLVVVLFFLVIVEQRRFFVVLVVLLVVLLVEGKEEEEQVQG